MARLCCSTNVWSNKRVALAAFATWVCWNPQSLSLEMTFAGQDLYADLVSKAVALGFALIKNHPFVDGNKRVGHAAMAVFLLLNETPIVSTLDEAESAMLGVADGTLSRDDLEAWLRPMAHPVK